MEILRLKSFKNSVKVNKFGNENQIKEIENDEDILSLLM